MQQRNASASCCVMWPTSAKAASTFANRIAFDAQDQQVHSVQLVIGKEFVPILNPLAISPRSGLGSTMVHTSLAFRWAFRLHFRAMPVKPNAEMRGLHLFKCGPNDAQPSMLVSKVQMKCAYSMQLNQRGLLLGPWTMILEGIRVNRCEQS